MSAHESNSRPGEGAASTVAGFLAAFAIFAAAAGLVYYPGRVGASAVKTPASESWRAGG